MQSARPETQILTLRPSRGLQIAYWACFLIAVAVAIRRVVVLTATPVSARPGLGELDAVFASHAALTLAHILPALAFVLLTPFVLLRATAQPGWQERLLYPLGLLVGVTAYAMSREATGGWTERSAVWFFNTLFLISLAQSMRYGQRRDGARQRRWLLRAIGILLGIATTRPVMAIFFATRSWTHLELDQFFGLAFWIGFSMNAVITEWWLATRAATREAVLHCSVNH